MNFLTELSERGFFHQCTNFTELAKIMEHNSITAYTGFDCTADSLHAGSLIQLMLLRLLQKYNHKIIILLGGATTKIGDPTGRDKARQLLTEDQITTNFLGIRQNFGQFLDLDPSKVTIVNNNDWLKELNYLDFLGNYGSHFSINRMLSFDSVKLRLERQQSLSYLEFNYMILQAYDFVYLNRNYNCLLQLGGSDQWGNIINGVELAKKINQQEVFGLTTPLLTNAQGAKMGKSVSGAVWLTQDKFSAYDYYQYWRNTEDNDVIKFLKLFTELPLEKIAKFAKLKGQDLNEAKKILAFEATRLCHGVELANDADKLSYEVFEQKNINQAARIINIQSTTDDQISIIDLMIKSNNDLSKSEARRLIRAKAVKINNQLITDEYTLINFNNWPTKQLLLSVGKKSHTNFLIG